MTRPIEFRALFRKISTGGVVWQSAALSKGKIVYPETTLQPGYIQITEWEQLTGITDQHNTKVFKGDIIEMSFGIPQTKSRFIVEWSDGYHEGMPYCGWWFRVIGEGHSGPAGSCLSDDIEVIGNIHQNKELMGE